MRQRLRPNSSGSGWKRVRGKDMTGAGQRGQMGGAEGGAAEGRLHLHLVYHFNFPCPPSGRSGASLPLIGGGFLRRHHYPQFSLLQLDALDKRIDVKMKPPKSTRERTLISTLHAVCARTCMLTGGSKLLQSPKPSFVSPRVLCFLFRSVWQSYTNLQALFISFPLCFQPHCFNPTIHFPTTATITPSQCEGKKGRVTQH